MGVSRLTYTFRNARNRQVQCSFTVTVTKFPIQADCARAFMVPEVWSSTGQLVRHGSPRGSRDANTDFGSIPPNTVLTRTFYVDNVGSGTLSLIVPSITSSNSSFVITQPSANSVPAGTSNSQTVSFTITFSSSTEGTFSSVIRIQNDARIRSPYTFAVTGRAVAPNSLTGLAASFSLMVDPALLQDAINNCNRGNSQARSVSPQALHAQTQQLKKLQRMITVSAFQSRTSDCLLPFANAIAKAAGVMPERVNVRAVDASRGLIQVTVVPSIDLADPTPTSVTTTINTQLRDPGSNLNTDGLGPFLNRTFTPNQDTVPVNLCPDGVWRESCDSSTAPPPAGSAFNLFDQPYFGPIAGLLTGLAVVAIALLVTKWRKRRAASRAPAAAGIGGFATGSLMSLNSQSQLTDRSSLQKVATLYPEEQPASALAGSSSSPAGLATATSSTEMTALAGVTTSVYIGNGTTAAQTEIRAQLLPDSATGESANSIKPLSATDLQSEGTVAASASVDPLEAKTEH